MKNRLRMATTWGTTMSKLPMFVLQELAACTVGTTPALDKGKLLFCGQYLPNDDMRRRVKEFAENHDLQVRDRSFDSGLVLYRI